MTSPHRTHNPMPKVDPFPDQRHELVCFAGMLIRDLGKDQGFIAEQVHIANGPVSAVHHLGVSGQGLAAQDNAFVGFCGGHGSSIQQRAGAVNGVSPWW